VLQVPAADRNVTELPHGLPAVARTASTRPTLAPTAASTLQAEKVIQDDLHRLDEDDDAVSQATSFVSSRAEGRGSDKLRVTRIQDMSKNHEPFECPYCFGIVQAKRQRSWRKHVLSDLRAYICTVADCGSGLFEDKEVWIRHEMDAHRRQWSCSTCGKKAFQSAKDLEQHMYRMHDASALPKTVLLQVAAASSQPISEISAAECPLCDRLDQDMREEMLRLGTEITASTRVMVPVRKLEDHLAEHLEQLALFAIPPTIDGNVESDSRKGRGEDNDHGDQHVSFCPTRSCDPVLARPISHAILVISRRSP